MGPSPGPNLDIQAELLNSAGTVLLTSNPVTLDASIAATLSAGTYYLRISGVAAGTVDTGYSKYGSIGNYIITGTLVSTIASVPPVAVVGASVFSGPAPAPVPTAQSIVNLLNLNEAPRAPVVLSVFVPWPVCDQRR